MRNSERMSKFTSRWKKHHRHACFANTQVSANNVSSHFEKTEQGKKRDARPWEEGKGLFNGESSGFCGITGDDPAATKNHSAPLKHRESHDEVFRPVHAGAALKSPIRAALQIRKGKHIDENNTREIFVGSLARRAGAPLRCVAYNRAIITTSLRHFIVASCNDCFN